MYPILIYALYAYAEGIEIAYYDEYIQVYSLCCDDSVADASAATDSWLSWLSVLINATWSSVEV